MPSQRAIAVGAGMAIGSAAIVAALLYMRSPARR
jgi:xanthosine utilization system XapX-like protein